MSAPTARRWGLGATGAMTALCATVWRAGQAFSTAGNSRQSPTLPSSLRARTLGGRTPKACGNMQGEHSGPSAASLVGSMAIVAVAARVAGSRIARRFQERYGGGASKKDHSAVPELGPQFVGEMGYSIQRKARLGRPKNGEQRVIPKLSGGSYEKRVAMFRNLTTEVIRHGRIKTTYPRAMALTHFVDRMVLLAKRGDDLSRREAGEWMFDEKLVDNLFKLAADRYPDQTKDFTKVTQTMYRKGDGAQMAYIELI
mmetsp:Transcript_70446/g.153018  ORF Transcript_70446/g.153018 Transcript_70446/m.153018 type:complete len:256 (+) Transcript_70446:99-866(+)